MDSVDAYHIQDYEMLKLEAANPPNDYGTYKDPAYNHGAVIENVVQTLQGNTGVGTNALEGMKIVDVIERIYQICGAGESTFRQ